MPSIVTLENEVRWPLIVVFAAPLFATPAKRRTKLSGSRPIKGSSAIWSVVTTDVTSALVVCTWLTPPSTTTTSDATPSSSTIGGSDVSRATSTF